MPGTIQPKKNNPNRSKMIRRKMKGEEREMLAKEPKLLSQVVPTEEGPDAAAEKPLVNSGQIDAKTVEKTKSEVAQVPEMLVKKFRDGLIVEQTLQYTPGKGKPIVYAQIRLTTVLRGKRKNDGLTEAAYLLRLEVLTTSEAARVEGIHLGPWQLNDLNLEAGSIFIAEPLWAGFQPRFGQIKGRFFLGDTVRNQLLDLPLKTEAVVPGPEAFLG